VLVRLSNAAGSPRAPDHVSSTGQVLGLAVRFELPSGKVASWAAVNLPSFLARTPDDFVRLTTALKPSWFGKPNLLRILFYLLSRPSAFPAFWATVTMRAPASFAEVRFNGIHTYVLVDAKGGRHPFRYHWAPRAMAAKLSRTHVNTLPQQYLLQELRSRLTAGAQQWDLVLHFPEPGDPLDDATRRWPDERRTVLAGTLTVDRVDDDQRAREPLVFDPTGVVPGIELSGDPLLGFRAEVYGESHHRRTHEAREREAPPDMGQ